MQTTLLGLAMALILALVAALVGPHFVDWNNHRAFFEAEASRLVGVNVKIAGDIDAGLLPIPLVTLNDIVIDGGKADRNPARGVGRLRAGSLKIELALGSLMRGELRATEMKLVAPQLRLGLDDKGHIDWPPLALAENTLSIDRLSIEDGRATLTDAASQSQFVLDRFWFTGDVRSLTGPIRGKGAFVSGNGLYGYEISVGRPGPEGTRLKLTLKTEERPLTVEAEGLMAFDRAAPGFEGTLTLSRPAVAVLASGQAAAYEPWRLTSKIKAEPSSATLDEVSFQYGPDERAVALTGSASFAFGAHPQMRGALAARQADLDRLLATAAMPRRLPFSAMQAFGDLLSAALRPTWPVRLSLNVDALTLGGGTLQNVSSVLRSDGTTWALDKLEFRAPGFTQVKAGGRLYLVDGGIGFSGPTSVDSNDPKNLLAWIAGRPSAVAQFKPWHAKGDVTLGPDRIAVAGLRTEFDRGVVEGSASYAWPSGRQPARLEADLHAGDVDLDSALALGGAAFSGLELERPGEMALALDVGKARLAGLDARNIAARLKLDAGNLSIDRLSIQDLGGMSFVATGRIQTQASPGGNITLYLDARDLKGLAALADVAAPTLAEPLRRLTTRQKTAVLRANIGLAAAASDRVNGTVGLSGTLGAIRLDASARAAGKREAFTLAAKNPLAGTDVAFKGQFDVDDPAPLLALFGIQGIAAADGHPARLTLAAEGPFGRDLRFNTKLDAGSIDLGGSGVLKVASGAPASLDLDQIAGTVAGSPLKGRLGLRFGETARIDGAIETESLNVPAVVAAAVGMPRTTPDRRGAANDTSAAASTAVGGGWSTEPFVWNTSGVSGRIGFKARRAVFASGIAAASLRGTFRFNSAEAVFEDIAGEWGKGRIEGRLAFANGDDGVSARVRLGLTDADLGAIFPGAGRPLSGRLALQAELEGTGRSPATFMGSLNGYGNVTLEQARIGGLDPGVFGAVWRATELGIPTSGNRIRDFVSGALDNSGLPVSRATADISIKAGQARFGNVAVKAAGADLDVVAGIDLTDATLNALLTLNGQPASPGEARPAVLVTLKGPLPTPQRNVDTSVLTSWLALRTADQKSRQIDTMERARREAAVSVDVPRSTSTPAEPHASSDVSSSPMSNVMSGPDETPTNIQAPALPAPVNIPVLPKPHTSP
ncbi:MAG TPA: AsmA-like C-terminal region-containing protein [Xanthobacteraceae bacterium]|nr:AsmA-like C-terminal region-containing protein [Xanthobacteraceae bacterium]